MNRLLTHEDTAFKKRVRLIAPLICGFSFLLLLLLPQPYVEGWITPVFWIYEKGGAGYLNVAALVCFILLMLNIMLVSYTAYKMAKIPTLEDLEIMVMQLHYMLPIQVYDGLLNAIKQLKEMTKEERKEKQAAIRAEILNTLKSYRDENTTAFLKMQEENEKQKKELAELREYKQTIESELSS